MKKFLSVSLITLFLASTLAGCADIDPKRVGQADSAKDAKGALKADLVDQLLAPPTGKDLYEEKTILKMSAGKATVQHADGVEVEVASELAMVPGDTIIVQAGGSATVLWFDDSISRLKEGTILTIDKADFDSKDITKTDINFHVVKGEIWNKVRGLVNPDSEFLSYAGSVVSGVRGSIYNLIVTGDEVLVESVAHSAFLAPVDIKTNTIGKEKRIVRGQLAKSIGKKTIKVEAIAPKRFKDAWFESNKVEDTSAVKVLREKNLNRLVKRVGILPGEPGYEDKISQIEDRLAKIKDPSQLAELQSRFDQLKARESIVLALKDPSESNAEMATSRLEAVRSALETKGLSEGLREKIRAETQVELQGLDRAMEEVLPDTKSLYEIKQSLREQQVDLAPDADTLKAIQDRMTERRYFELNDAAELPNFEMPKDLQVELDSAQKDLQRISDFWQENALFQQDYLDIVKDIQANPADAAAIQKLTNYFQDPAFQQKLQETQKVMEQALPAIQEQLKNLPTGTLPTTELPIQLPSVNLLGEPAVEVPTLPNDTIDLPTTNTEIAPELDPLPTINTLPTIDTTKLNLLNTTLPTIR